MESKEVYVKAHVRIIRQKVYRFVCKDCNQVSERICFPSQPLYCERCRPPKTKEVKVAPAVAAAGKISKQSARKKATANSVSRKKRTNLA